MEGPAHLPNEIWTLIFEHRAAMVMQRVTRQKNLRHLHFGHVHNALWPTLRQFLDEAGLLRKMYPYPLTRREWRTEMGSWYQLSVTLYGALLRDMEDDCNWGRPSLKLKS